MNKNRHILLAMSYYHPQIHQGISQYAAENGWHLSAKMTIDGKLPWGWNGDGAIVQAPNRVDYKKFVSELQVPKVSMGSYTGWDCPIVDDDHQAVGIMAADYFLEKGFKNFAIYIEDGFSLAQTQLTFCEYLENKGYQVAQIKVTSGLDNWEEASTNLANCLKSLPKPLAVYCNRDYAGAEVINSCMRHDISVPFDVAVLGKHNNELVCNALLPQLSSVDNSLVKLGYKAAELLDQMIDGKNIDRKTTIPPQGVVSRASTELLAVKHKNLQKALAFIKENFREPIGVGEVTSVVAMSERGLQQAFKTHLDCSIAEVIFKHRLECTKNLLQTTDWPIEVVAQRSGFKSMRNFFSRFKKRVGVTPKQFRKK